MKTLVTLFSLLISAQISAAETTPCKSEAQLAIYQSYTFESPDAVISLSATKSYISGDEAVFLVNVVDLESGETTLMSAIMDAKTCKVKAIN